MRLYSDVFPTINNFREQLQKGLGVWVRREAIWPIGQGLCPESDSMQVLSIGVVQQRRDVAS